MDLYINDVHLIYGSLEWLHTWLFGTQQMLAVRLGLFTSERGLRQSTRLWDVTRESLMKFAKLLIGKIKIGSKILEFNFYYLFIFYY